MYYSLYLFGLFIYFYQHVFDIELVEKYYAYINFPIQFFAYASFTRSLLETRLHDVKWDKYLELITRVLLGLCPMFILIQLTLGHSVKIIEQKSKNAEIKLVIKQKQMEELKMTALQSQMNPHFLFNSLNSINNFVLKNDIEKASDYITKFSRLIRVILKSSSSLTIPLSEELGILGLYVKLEKMRIKGGFEYIVNVDGDLNLEEIEVPPLFLQPYIENSIWHGIMHVDADKKVELTIKKEGDSIKCEIVDNGIGIDNSKRQPHRQINRRKFFGTQATESRIKLLHRQANVVVDISDISDEEISGTKVTLVFPITLK